MSQLMSSTRFRSVNSTNRANVRKVGLAQQSTIQTEQNDTRVGQSAADYDQVVQIWTRHFDVSARNESWLVSGGWLGRLWFKVDGQRSPLLAILDVHGEKDQRQNDAEDREDGQDDEQSERNTRRDDLFDGPIHRGTAACCATRNPM
jgi:hypothetical protein